MGALHMCFLFWLSIVILNEYYLIFVLLFDMDVLILSLWANLISMIARSYLLLRYVLTPTSFIYSFLCSIWFIILSFRWYPLISLSIATLTSPYLVETLL